MWTVAGVLIVLQTAAVWPLFLFGAITFAVFPSLDASASDDRAVAWGIALPAATAATCLGTLAVMTFARELKRYRTQAVTTAEAKQVEFTADSSLVESWAARIARPSAAGATIGGLVALGFQLVLFVHQFHSVEPAFQYALGSFGRFPTMHQPGEQVFSLLAGRDPLLTAGLGFYSLVSLLVLLLLGVLVVLEYSHHAVSKSNRRTWLAEPATSNELFGHSQALPHS